MRDEIRAGGSGGDNEVYMYIAACNNSFKLLDMTSDLASKDENSSFDTSQVEDALILYVVLLPHVLLAPHAWCRYGRECQTKIAQEIMKDLQNSFLYFFCCPEDETKPNWLRNSRVEVCSAFLRARA